MAKRKNNKYSGNNKLSEKNPGINDNKKQILEAMKEKEQQKKENSDKEEKKIESDNIEEEQSNLFMSKEEILKKEKLLDEKKKKLEQNSDELDKKKVELTKKENDIKGNQKKLDKQEAELTKKEKELLELERSLIEREKNAQNGFLLENKKSIEILRKQCSQLERDIEGIEKEKYEKESEINNYIKELREKKLAVLDDEIENLFEMRKNEIQSKISQIEELSKIRIKHEEETIEEKLQEIFDKKEKLEQKESSILEKELDVLEKEKNYRIEKNLFEKEKSKNEERINHLVKLEVEAIKSDFKYKDEDIEYYKEKIQLYKDELSNYKRLEKESNGQSFEDLLRLNELLRTNIKELEDEKLNLPSQDLFIEYKAKADAFDEKQRELNEVKRQLADLQQQRFSWEKTINQLSIARERYMILEKHIEVNQASLKKYAEEVNRYKSLYEQPKELSGRLDAILKYQLEVKSFKDYSESELKWLESIYNKCIESGVQFNKRLLKSFHTSLKTAEWSPITVLAGVSGTGKSLLPEYYCRYGGIYFMSMAVQPDWDSPQSLFGYFNSVDNRFNATTLLRALVQFCDYNNLEGSIEKMLKLENVEEYLQKLKVEEHNLNDAMFLVLLDEMNLAHVELYFSDMLSKLERRRNSNENIAIDIDLGAGMDKFPLELANNVLWAGTMNEDETTKSLSDKVLDRGNLISFPRPKQFISRSKVESMDAVPMIKKSTWELWVSNNVIENEDFKKMITKYKEGLEAVNEAMEFAGRALGHRVWQSIENYMANHPDVIEAFISTNLTDTEYNINNMENSKESNNINQEECEKCLSEAFEEALVHKVMPKLRGIETDGETKVRCIDKIKDILFVKKLAPGLEADFENAINNTYGVFLWNSAKYLEEKE